MMRNEGVISMHNPLAIFSLKRSHLPCYRITSICSCVTFALFNFSLFTTNEILKVHLAGLNVSEHEKSFMTGAISGGVALTVFIPFELIKIRA